MGLFGPPWFVTVTVGLDICITRGLGTGFPILVVTVTCLVPWAIPPGDFGGAAPGEGRNGFVELVLVAAGSPDPPTSIAAFLNGFPGFETCAVVGILFGLLRITFACDALELFKNGFLGRGATTG